MARQHRAARLHSGIADFRSFTATRRWQWLMAAAIASFLICHAVAEQTVAPAFAAAPVEDALVQRQLLHVAAVILRFALPYAFLAWAFGGYWAFRRARVSRP